MKQKIILLLFLLPVLTTIAQTDSNATVKRKAPSMATIYTMDGKPDLWKIAYYPIFEDGKTNQPYNEARSLIEKPMKGGTDFREVPLRYLSKSSR